MAFNKDSFAQVMNEKVAPVAQKLGSSKYLQTISQSMMSTLAPLILGSFAVLLLAFPIPAVSAAVAASGFTGVLAAVNTFTIGSMSLYVVFLMAKNLVEKLAPGEDGTLAGVLALMSFLILTPLGTTVDEVSALPTTWLGAQGVFSAMIIGLTVGRIYTFFRVKGWSIKMPASVPPMVTQVFESLIPGLVIGAFMVLVARLFAATPFGSLHECIFTLIQTPLKGIGGSLPAIILCSLIQQFLWFFGIHGTNVIIPIVTPLWMAMDAENLAALAAGQALPNIGGLAFFNIITWGGLALGLVLLMLFSKSQQYRALGKVAIVPALFGITEPVIFGTPLVLNFDFMVPFITNNTIALIISAVLMSIGVVQPCVGAQTVFGLPLGFHALVGGSVFIVLLQLFIQLVLSPILWFPWFKRAEKKALALERQADQEA